MGIEVSVTEFKAKCLEYFDRLSRHEIESISVTRRGKRVGVITPVKLSKEEAQDELRAWQAKAKGSIWIDKDFDLTQPTSRIDDWDAYHGKVFPDEK